MQKKIETIKEMLALSRAGSDEKKALKAALRALNKQKPRPPMFDALYTDDETADKSIYCPACDSDLTELYTSPQTFEYCPVCGQALEWDKYFNGGMIQ